MKKKKRRKKIRLFEQAYLKFQTNIAEFQTGWKAPKQPGKLTDHPECLQIVWKNSNILNVFRQKRD